MKLTIEKSALEMVIAVAPEPVKQMLVHLMDEATGKEAQRSEVYRANARARWEKAKQTEPKEPKPPKAPTAVQMVPVPEPLQTPEFLAKWQEWQLHRSQIHHRLTPLAASKQLAMLSAYDVPTAIGIIERSIQSGYQGLFPSDVAPLTRAAKDLTGI